MFVCANRIGSGLLIAICLSGSLCRGDELFEEVKAGLTAAESRLENCSLRARYRVLAVKDGKDVHQTAIYSVFQGEYFSVTTFDPQSGLETVRVANDRYVFALTKQRGADRYAILEFQHRRTSDKSMQRKIDAAIAGIRSGPFVTYTLASAWPASDLVRDPGFRVGVIRGSDM